MADSALVTDINKVISDFFSSKSAGGTSTSTGAVIATSRKEVLVLPAQQIQILSIGYTSLVDIAIYVENANILPDNPINTTVNTVQLTMTDANSTAASTLSLNNKNAIFTASNRRLSTLTITNNYAVNITLSVHYTVKEYNPDLITTSGNIQQVIGDVNVISQQNVAPPIVGTINAISGIGSSVTATNISNFPTCLVTVNGTYSGITIQFTISDDNGVTFYGANAYELTSGRATQSWALPDNLKDAFYVPIIGADQLKVSVTAYGSGTLNVNITPISTAVSEYIHVGQATMANSEPVVVASDQSNIGSSLNAINGNPLQVVPLGQAIMNDSIPVAIALDQSCFSGLISISEAWGGGTTSHDIEIIPGVAGQTIRIIKLMLYTASGNTIILKTDGATTAINGAGWALGANSGFAYDGDLNSMTLPVGQELTINLLTKNNVSGFVQYTQS